jgi:hypothetical protein
VAVLFTRGCYFITTLISPVVRFRAPSDVVSEPVVVMVLREQLLVRESELEEWQDTFLAREHGMVEARHALSRTHVDCNIVHDQATTVREHYQARCALISSVGSILYCLTGFWVDTSSFCLCRRQNLNGRRKSWSSTRHVASILLMGGACYRNWESFASASLELKMIMPLRLSNCCGRSRKYLMPWST